MNAGCAGKTVRSLENACHTWAPYRCVHDEALYKYTFTFTFTYILKSDDLFSHRPSNYPLSLSSWSFVQCFFSKFSYKNCLSLGRRPSPGWCHLGRSALPVTILHRTTVYGCLHVALNLSFFSPLPSLSFPLFHPLFCPKPSLNSAVNAQQHFRFILSPGNVPLATILFLFVCFFVELANLFFSYHQLASCPLRTDAIRRISFSPFSPVSSFSLL